MNIEAAPAYAFTLAYGFIVICAMYWVLNDWWKHKE